MTIPSLKKYILTFYCFVLKFLHIPLPILRKKRMAYLKKTRGNRSNTPVAHNEILMKQFPSIKKNPFLYLFFNRDFKLIGMRILMLIVTGTWFAVFPVYLFVIYMYEMEFFSYEFFTVGVFGLKSFFLVMLLLIVVLSLYLYGFLLVGRFFYVDYVKSGKFSIGSRLVFWLVVVVGAFFHALLFFTAVSADKLSLFYTLLASSLILILYFCTFIKLNRVDGVVNWIPSAVFLFVSMSLPFLNTSNVAEAVEIGLRKFSVGPGKMVTVFDKSNTDVIASGNLLLWSPEFVYFKDEKDKLHAYPTKNGTHIVVSSKYNKRVN